MSDMASYYEEVKPSFHLMKEAFRRRSREEILRIIESKSNVTDIDSFFLKDATEFLRLSVLNLLAYKFLMSGKFSAWGEVTLYYGNFYSINCLLRLKGFAIVHLDFPDEETLRFRVQRVRGKREYGFLQWRGGSPHQYLWKKFSELYPELCTPQLGKILIKDRVSWNYDLFYPSQSMADYAKKEAKIRWENNFLAPNYGMSHDPDAAEYYHDLMVDYGYEEAGSGGYIRACINSLTKIAEKSRYRTWYISYFEGVRQGIEEFSSHPQMTREIQNWIQSSITELEEGEH